jgi:hydrogenase expression/formation protein HypE
MTDKKLRMQLQCPMPKLDFDIITLGHGSGGLLTNKLLDNGVFDLLKNEKLDKRHDGAVLDYQGPVAFTTDSFVISPVFFPGGNIGELAVNGTVNDLAMCGAIPKHLSLSFILEEGLTMEAFWEILVSIKFACADAGVEVVTGDTKVVEKGKGDKIFINTTGLGPMHPNAQIDVQRVEVGDQIIVSGNLATHGIAIMSVREGLEFETDIESDTCNLNHTVKNLLDAFGPAIKLLRDPTRGGVATVLNEIARDTKRGKQLKCTPCNFMPLKFSELKAVEQRTTNNP